MTSKETQYWLDQCKRHMTVRGQTVKVAELGGDGQDAPFEQSFSNLAHAYLRDKAPTLLDHEIGFQLLDRNQENTKAVGVFAFKVGSQSLFAPVFFLQGDLKGHELLYLKSQDMFVPLKENWLNYILNRKPNILGTGVQRQTQSMGVMQPDLNRLSESPYKTAAATSTGVPVIPSLESIIPMYSYLKTANWTEKLAEYETHCSEALDLEHFLKQASLPALEACVDLMQRKPVIAAAFDEWHGMGVLQSAIKEARVRLDNNSVIDNPYRAVNRNQQQPIAGSVLDHLEKEAADGDKGPDVKGKIRILTIDASWVDGMPEGLDEEDAEKLLKDNVLIEDHREGDEVSVPLRSQVEKRLTNPTETGIYQVLVKANDFERCLIITDPMGPDGRKPFCTVIRLDEEKRNWGNFPRNDVWVAGLDEYLGGEEDWREFYDSLSDTKSLSAGGVEQYVVIGHRRNGTFPFTVEKEIGSFDGATSYDVKFSCDCEFGRHLSKGLHRYHNTSDYEWFDEYDKWRDGQRIHLKSKNGTDMRSNHGDVFIPTEFKVLKVSSSAQDARAKKDKEFGCCVPMSPFDDKQSETPPIQPGNIMDATLSIMTKTAGLKIAASVGGYSINDSRVLPEIEAVVHLVADHGFREDISRHMLKEAQSNYVGLRNEPFECIVKYASPFLTQGAPSAPAIPEPDMGRHNPMGFAGPTVDGTPMEMQVPGMSAALTDPSVYNVNPANMEEPMDANGVMQAAATGQKEVFDTAMIGSMLKAVRDDTMIDRYLPDLIKGMDRVGRILFMFYWHQDKFAGRYGKQDLPELEDSIRNTFEMIGDVILFLKQKTIEPYPEEDVRDIDLGSATEM